MGSSISYDSFGWRDGKVGVLKIVGKWKSGKIEKFLISLIFAWLRVKSGGMEKMSLYKFTHIPLLKNDAQLKQKVTSNQKTKSPKLY